MIGKTMSEHHPNPYSRGHSQRENPRSPSAQEASGWPNSDFGTQSEGQAEGQAEGQDELQAFFRDLSSLDDYDSSSESTASSSPEVSQWVQQPPPPPTPPTSDFSYNLDDTASVPPLVEPFATDMHVPRGSSWLKKLVVAVLLISAGWFGYMQLQKESSFIDATKLAIGNMLQRWEIASQWARKEAWPQINSWPERMVDYLRQLFANERIPWPSLSSLKKTAAEKDVSKLLKEPQATKAADAVKKASPRRVAKPAPRRAVKPAPRRAVKPAPRRATKPAPQQPVPIPDPQPEIKPLPPPPAAKPPVASRPLPPIPPPQAPPQALPRVEPRPAVPKEGIPFIPDERTMPPTGRYTVQVTTCFVIECLENFAAVLKALDHQPYLRTLNQNTQVLEVSSAATYAEREAAERVADNINREGILPSLAYIIAKEDSWRVSLGLFTELDDANLVRRKASRIGVGTEFQARVKNFSYPSYQILLGPFESSFSAESFATELRHQHVRFSSALVSQR